MTEKKVKLPCEALGLGFGVLKGQIRYCSWGCKKHGEKDPLLHSP